MFKPLNQEEFYIRELLKFYIDTNTFLVSIIRENENGIRMFEEIKEHLRKHFTEQEHIH